MTKEPTTYIMLIIRIYFAESNIEQVLETSAHKTAAVRPPTTLHENYQNRRTRHAGHCWRSRDEFVSDVLLHRDEQRQDVQLKPTYSSSVPILDVALSTCQKQWTIGMGSERGPEMSLLAVRHDDDDTYLLTPPNKHVGIKSQFLSGYLAFQN